MKNKILLITSLILFSIYQIQKGSIREDTSFLVDNTQEENIYSDKVEEYLFHVVSAEMPASFEMESLKSQAIAARTFTYYMIYNSSSDYDFYNDHVSQAFATEESLYDRWGVDYNKYKNKILEAVETTKDLVLTYDNEIIKSYYYAMSNGKTESSLNVFNEEHPYLISIDSKEPTNNDNYKVTTELSKSEFLYLLEIPGDTITIDNIVKDESYRVETIVINNKKFTGIEIRKILNLRSTDFEIAIEDDKVEITTRGYGHGVGMSQYGSNELAKDGKNFTEILSIYYPETEIKNINSILLK